MGNICAQDKRDTYDKPLFFLFTCVFNGRNYITKLFDSLLSQNTSNFVHYIYEDGSAEPIYDLVESYKRKASNLPKPFKVIYEYNKVNMGLNYSTKHCIEKCDLPFFIWLNCDDYVENSFFIKLERTIRKAKILPTVIRCNLFTIEQNNAIRFIDKYSKNARKFRKFSSQYMQFASDLYVYGHFCVNANVYKNNRFLSTFSFQRDVFNDCQVILHSLLYGGDHYYCDNITSFTIMHSDSESQTPQNKNYKQSCLDYYKKIIQDTNSSNSLLLENCFLINRLYNKQIALIKEKKYKEALEVIASKEALAKSNHISVSLTCTERNDLYWKFFCRFPRLFSLFRKIKNR